ncbi:transcriptional regulator [Rhodococcus tibetensis]|uniref:Transcriptional regulator n=1 Tax=Rhodococcus tibetensis TaxID=2965064 RepID=A0ABT1QF10_9NOCA|nr:transcriptional regulator [Rhodococcus sp. FXJ9.536]MCQ4120253.1 transcriptional regulator [Rhodococcus sp. FXJ9.536]
MPTLSGLEDTDPAVRNLSSALIARDVVTVRRIIARAAAERGLTTVWEGLVVPVLEWADEGRNSAAAAVNCRVFAECVAGILSTMTLDAPIAVGGRVLLVDVPPDCDDPGPLIAHDLALRALGAALATASVDVRIARPAVRTALLASVTNAGPDVIVLWLPQGHCDVPALARAIRRRRSGLALLAAGPGAAAAHLPRSVKAVGRLGDAVDAVVALI